MRYARSVLAALLLSSTLVATSAPPAKASCLFCFGLGYMMGSSPNNSPAASGDSTIYIAPKTTLEGISEADRLNVRVAATNALGFSPAIMPRDDIQGQGKTFDELFASALKDKTQADKYVVLQIVWVPDPNYVGKANFWFFYIEKERVSKSPAT